MVHFLYKIKRPKHNKSLLIHIKLNLNFSENYKSFEHFNVLLRIFFVLSIVRYFDIYFWTLLKEEKVRS